MNRSDTLKAAALQGSIQTISKLIVALQQQLASMQQQLNELLEG